MKNVLKQKKFRAAKSERIYPLFFKDKWYFEKDVDDIFAAFYHTKYALGFNCSVYVSEGLRICPDGTWEND